MPSPVTLDTTIISPEVAILSRLRILSRPFRHALLYRLIMAMGHVVGWMPLRWARSFGRGVGRMAYALAFNERRQTFQHLALAFPDKDLRWRRSTARAIFSNLGQSAVDFFRLRQLAPEDLDSWIAEVRGIEHLQAGATLGLGTLVVTPHLGHWELLGIWTAARMPLAAVARQLFDQRMDSTLNKRRVGAGLRLFPRNTSVLPILRWLKEGGVLGVLADQDTSVDSLFCDFFGHAAKTPTGGVLLAQAAKARLITGYCWRQADGRYVIEFEAAIPVPERSERDVMALWPAAQEYTRRIEAKIRQHPEQWVWMHRRWKSRIDQDSNGWKSKQAQACLIRIQAWVAHGRPELKA